MSKRVVIITGGGQGIGRAVALHLLETGYTIVIAEVDPEARVEINAMLLSQEDGIVIPCDVRKEEDIQNAVRLTVQKYGRLDAVIHNAAVSANGPIEAMALEDWNNVIAVNLTAGFLLAKHAAVHLRKAHGSVVNLASTRAIMSEPDTEAYSASKGGILALTHALAVSLGPEIRVNCISPGWIETGDWQKSSKAKNPSHTDADRLQHPAGRVGRPDDISRAVAFLIDPENSFITGENIVIDGGMTKKMIYV